MSSLGTRRISTFTPARIGEDVLMYLRTCLMERKSAMFSCNAKPEKT
jgi:hypothetical protein